MFSHGPWLPKLIEIEYLKHYGTEEEQEYFSQFGFEKIVIPESYTHIAAISDYLKTLFDQRYSARRIGWETMEMWQIHLQKKFDEESGWLERALTLYERYASKMDADLFEGMETTSESSSESSGIDTVDGTSEMRNIDTPDLATNQNPNYADTRASGTTQDKTTYGKKDESDASQTTEIHGRSVMDNINASIRDKLDLETAFIEKFENLFLNVFDY